MRVRSSPLFPSLGRFPRPFYGWYIVLAGMVITFASGPGQSFMFTVFIDPIIDDTGYTRTTISSIYASGTIISALAVLIVSRLSDRKGPRSMLIIMASVFGLACIGLSFASGLIALGIALALLRGLGQGAMPINSSLLVSQWFIRQRGRALAILGLGGAATIAIMPNLGQFLIEQVGWRGAYFALGLMVWALVIPLAVFVIRNKPEDMGMFPDGARQLPEDEIRRVKAAQAQPKRRVLTSFNFWALAFPMAIPALVDTALVFHQVSLFERQGLTPEVAARVFIPFAVASAVTGLASGFIVERIGPTPMFAINMGIFLGAIVMLQFMNSPFAAVIYAIILGGAMGMQQMGARYTWPYYFGRQGLGQVQGSAMMIMISATAIGPVLFAAVAEGISYNVAFGGMVVLVIVAAIMRLSYRLQPA
jgi:MFS family permease